MPSHSDAMEDEWVLAATCHPQTAAQAAAFQQQLVQQQALLTADGSSNNSSAVKGKQSDGSGVQEEEKDQAAAVSAGGTAVGAASSGGGGSGRKNKYRSFLHRLIIPAPSATTSNTLALPATHNGNNQQPLSPLSARSSSSSSFSSHSSASPMPLHAAAPPPSPNPTASPSPMPASPPSPHSSRAHTDYATAELLRFEADDILHVIARDIDTSNPGWWYGTVVGSSCKPGRFPGYLTHRISSAEGVASSYSPNTSTTAAEASSAAVSPAVADEESSRQQRLVNKLREKVSKKKRRYQRDGYDLDLSYITPNIIAMGFPSESLEGLYRNHMSDVQQFLTQRHGDKFKVVNLCSERAYPADRFPHTARYPFDDHQPSSMDMIHAFCEDAHAWLSQGSDYVVATHCKAGKGRTGYMIACYLLYSGMFTEAEEALRFYAVRRTKNAKGVTIPSQIRFIHYYQKLLQSHTIPYAPSTAASTAAAWPRSIPSSTTTHPVLLLAIRFHGIPRGAINKEISFTLKQSDGTTHSSSRASLSVVRSSPPAPPSLTLTSSSSSRGLASLQGDVQCVFFASTRFDSAKLFQVWFCTRFLGHEMEGVRCRRETESVVRVEGSGSVTSSGPLLDSAAETGSGWTAGVCDAIHGDRWELLLSKAQLDKACKDTKHKHFPPDFRVEMLFAHVL